MPEAEKANVRLALHPNDPPVPLWRGSEQIMASVEQWKTYLKLVKSPFNGMTFDCGVTREMGEDPVEVCRYLSERDCINHVHFRNVVVRTPYVDYTEVFLDNGQVDMFGVMRELVRQKYPRGLYPEHPRRIDIGPRARQDPEPVSGRRRLRRRDLQRRLCAGHAAGGAHAVMAHIGQWWMRNAYLTGLLAAMLGSFAVAVTLVYWLGPFLTALTSRP